ncbi:MAG: hypothetical protein IT176_00955 [Acidobacteria bacterium]|nr:hypothetical protein [Acidobacteriota bacterium]
MNRARFGVAASLVAVAVAAGPALAQSAPQLTPVLAGREFTAPIKGEATVDFTKANVKKDKDLVTATFFVKNTSDKPIARLQVDDIWYDDKGEIVTGGKGVIQGVLKPGEIQEMKIETIYNSKMKTNNWKFAHANGSIIPTQVDTMEGLPEGAMIGGKPAPKPKPATE